MTIRAFNTKIFHVHDLTASVGKFRGAINTYVQHSFFLPTKGIGQIDFSEPVLSKKYNNFH